MTLKRSLASIVLGAFAAANAQVQGPPVPDLGALLRDVIAHQHKLDDIRENWTFRQIVHTDELDAGGAVKKTTTKELEIFFVNGHQITQLLKKDGAALTASEQKSEQDRVRKAIEKYTKAGFSSPDERSMRLISEILAVVKISNPRRVSLNGRSTLAFDFTGDPRAKASNMAQNAAKRTAGTVWIDEADRQVARLSVAFEENFRVGGGLLGSIQKGSQVEVEQAPLGNGLWMQTAMEEHLSARVIVKGIRQNIHIRNVDFKKFDVGVASQILPPAQ